jgi:hypothetical protein
MLFKDGAIKKWSVCVYAVNASARMTAECCAMPVQTCQNPVTGGYDRMAAVAFANCLICKLPLLFDLNHYK